jgi:hypothetical protein
VQKRLRGLTARKGVEAKRAAESAEALAQRAAKRRTRDHWVTRWVRSLGREIANNHTVISLCFADPENQRRAEIVQTFWNVLALGAMIEAALFSNSDGPPSLVGALLTSLITAVLTVPALLLFFLIFSLAYGRRGSTLERLFREVREYIAYKIKQEADAQRRASADLTGAELRDGAKQPPPAPITPAPRASKRSKACRISARCCIVSSRRAEPGPPRPEPPGLPFVCVHARVRAGAGGRGAGSRE